MNKKFNKETMKSFKDKLLKIIKNKTFIGISIILIIIVLIIVFVSSGTHSFVLNEIYDVYPEEVRTLYANIVSVSCDGDLGFNIGMGNRLETKKIDKNDLLKYLFSNLEKNEKLEDEMTVKEINKASDRLFYGDIDLADQIKDFQYGDYIYNVQGNKITRKENKCVGTHNYVSNLYGYSWNEDKLSLDVNIGYMQEDILYDIEGNKLGSYDGIASKLPNLFTNNAYYRLQYVKNGTAYKLYSIELKSRV